MNSAAQAFEQAVAFHRAGDLHQAERLYREILVLEPGHTDALHLFGVLAHQVGRDDVAVESIQQALRLSPACAEAHNNLGIVLMHQGKRGEALASYRHALALKPDYAEAHNNFANALKQDGDIANAIAGYQQALILKPDYYEAFFNLGVALAALGRLEEAGACYRQALLVKPDLADAHNSMGLALKEQGKTEEAIECYRQALGAKPEFPEAFNNLGNALKEGGLYDEAVASFRQALALKPEFPEAHNNLGNVLKDQGKLDEALTAVRAGLLVKPDSAAIHDNLVFMSHYHPAWDSATLYQEARRWNDLHAAPLAKYHGGYANTTDPGRRLRIGYVSPDLRTHPLSNVLLPLLANHDRRQVEVYCYAEVMRPDDVTRRLRGWTDVWRATVGLSDEQLAELVRQDRIDILVDLALHSARNRLLVFARKPAPVQVTWLGYPGTTGLTAIDYRLTDPYLDPPGGDDAFYSEESIRLPETFWCYEPAGDEVMVEELPALRNGWITLGCLNNFCKVNDGVLAAWVQVLHALPRARLLLHVHPGSVREHVAAKFQQEGIARGRVQFVGRQSKVEYLQLHNQIDIGLDPWPCNGGVTSLDALWMGVPIVTRVGETVVGRTGLSLLSNLGLADLAAWTTEEYVANVVRLAGDLPRLQELRAGLRARLRASPLMNAPRFARHVEQAYRHMWRRWCG
jgi:predicted O-linked N-acetylglucosamine transferase (SPINDLY family)